MTELVQAPVATVWLRNALQARVDTADLDWWVATEWVDRPEIVVVISRAGGVRANLVVDRPQMLVEIFGPDSDACEDAGQVVEAWIAALPMAHVDAHRVEWLSGPVWYPAPGRPRVQMSFYLRLRMQALQEG